MGWQVIDRNRAGKVLGHAVLGLALSLASCASDESAEPSSLLEERELRSALERSGPVAGAEATAVEDLTGFALGFYAGLAKPNGNFVYSPYSIAVAAAMLSAGAASNTLAQLQSALRFSHTGTPLHEAHNTLSQLLATRNRDAQGLSNAQILRVSNDFWMLPKLEPKPEFLDVLAEHYGAGVHLTAMDEHPDEARRAINAKISSDTGELIPELLPPGSIDEQTVFVLTNALYVRAIWASKFAKAATAPGPFTTLAGSTVEVSLMHRQLPARYLQGDGFIAFVLSYERAELGMWFLVPDLGNFEQFAQQLNVARLAEIASGLQSEELILSLPKFTLASELPLREALRAAGMSDAFDPERADFSGIAPDVFLSSAFHQARLLLDEDGTTATAATAFTGAGAGLPPVPIPVVVDRPFLFLLRDASGAILFMGQLATPG